MDWAIKQGVAGEFKFHDIDNLIFLRNANHTAGTMGHNAYDALIRRDLDALEDLFESSPTAAFSSMKNIVKKYRESMIDHLIGSKPPKKLDDLKQILTPN
jgi:phosphate uptake regulator